MKVLVVGAGGREHALCWKLARSPAVEELYCAPGNPGIAALADRVPTAVEDIHELVEFAVGLSIDLTVVGPELPLALGLVDELEKRGLPVFGPTRRAAELESSKVFAKRFMERHGIPTAEFEVAHDADQARRFARRLGFPVVLKADGLAAGKGVLIVHDRRQLKEALAALFDERRFGDAAAKVVVERCLEGEEVSFIALSDGERVLPMATSKDYKRIGEGDSGPNTGGMGAHSPSGVIARRDAEALIEQILKPTVVGMAEENRPFRGFLYAGLMLTDDGPKVLEYNVRCGDPEAQALLLRMDGDLAAALAAGAGAGFGGGALTFRQEAAACIVLASAGYPGSAARGEPIEGIEEAAAMPGVEIFHAGTDERDGRLVTAGGRVLNVCALGSDLIEALQRAYAAAAEIRWPSKVLRRDIGRRVLENAG